MKTQNTNPTADVEPESTRVYRSAPPGLPVKEWHFPAKRTWSARYATATQHVRNVMVLDLLAERNELLEAFKHVQSKLGEYEGKGDRRQGEIIILAWETARAAIQKAEAGQ